MNLERLPEKYVIKMDENNKPIFPEEDIDQKLAMAIFLANTNEERFSMDFSRILSKLEIRSLGLSEEKTNDYKKKILDILIEFNKAGNEASEKMLKLSSEYSKTFLSLMESISKPDTE